MANTQRINELRVLISNTTILLDNRCIELMTALETEKSEKKRKLQIEIMLLEKYINDLKLEID